MQQSLDPNRQGSTETFGQAIRKLRLERGLSMEELAYRTRDNDPDRNRRGLSFSYISLIERDYRHATPEVIELLAHTLEVSPRDFGEYRLALVRRLFDEDAVGADQALSNLDFLQNVVEEYRPQASREDAEALARFEDAFASG